MTELVKSLRDAPVMNLFVLVGFMLVVLAAIGKAGKKRVDTGGRFLSGTCGVGLLAAATVMFLGLEKARATPPVNRTPPGADELRMPPPPAAPTVVFDLKPTPAPAPVQPGTAPPAGTPPSTRRLLSDPVSVQWGCAETVTGKASLVLPPGVRLVSAEVLVDRVEQAKSYAQGKPTWDKGSRVCTGEATFQGLDRVFLNCPGGGRATMRILAVVTGP